MGIPMAKVEKTAKEKTAKEKTAKVEKMAKAKTKEKNHVTSLQTQKKDVTRDNVVNEFIFH